MSRIGRKTIKIPAGVTVSVDNSLVEVKGPKGLLGMSVRPEIKVEVKNDGIMLTPNYEGKNVDAFWGMTRAILANMVEGVTEGFEKTLELVGVGYRVKQSGPSSVTLSLGFSHPVEFKAPEGVLLQVTENNVITIKGTDKQLVGVVAADIRKLRKPEPYKGKGIRYSGEVVRRKAGKASKAGAK